MARTITTTQSASKPSQWSDAINLDELEQLLHDISLALFPQLQGNNSSRDKQIIELIELVNNLWDRIDEARGNNVATWADLTTSIRGQAAKVRVVAADHKRLVTSINNAAALIDKLVALIPSA